MQKPRALVLVPLRGYNHKDLKRIMWRNGIIPYVMPAHEMIRVTATRPISPFDIYFLGPLLQIIKRNISVHTTVPGRYNTG